MRSEGPQEILQLILQEQVDGFMDEKIIDVDDYADWMRWVSDAEQSKRAMYESTHDADVPFLLQQPSRRDASSIPALRQIVQMKDGNSNHNTTEQLGSSSHEEKDIRWREICQQIKMTIAWMRDDSNNSGKFWSGIETFLLGTRVN